MIDFRPRTIDELVAPYPASVRRLVQASRRRIQKLVPHAEERLRPGWGLIGYNAPAYFAFVAPMNDHVRIGLEWGVDVPDARELLAGEGSQVRHLCVRRLADLRRRGVAEIIRAAAALPPRRAGRR